MKLLATLYWSSQPAETLNDYGPTGAVITRSITVAESHDGSDLTYERLTAPDDVANSINGNADLWLERALDTAAVSGQIAQVIVKARAARINATNCAGQYDVVMNGAKVGTADTLTATITNYSRTFTTDPADGQPWTNAKINGKTWGAVLSAQSTAPSFNRNPTASLYEWSVEIWGQDAQPSPLQVGAALIAPLVVPGAIAIAAGLLAVGCSLVTPTVTNSSSSTVASPAPIGVAAELVAPKVTVQDFETISRIETATLASTTPGPFRPTDPVELGDGDTDTILQDLWLSGTHAGTLAVEATAIAPGTIDGAIEHVEFKTFVGIYNTGVPYGRYVASRIRWITGGVSDSATIAIPAIMSIESPTIPGEFPLDIFERSTGPILKQPNGQPWTIEAINALTSIKVELDYNAVGFDIIQFAVAEIWVEASGIENRGTNKRPLEFPMQIGHGRKRISIGTNPTKTKLALPKPLKFTMPLGGE